MNENNFVFTKTGNLRRAENWWLYAKVLNVVKEAKEADKWFLNIPEWTGKFSSNQRFKLQSVLPKDQREVKGKTWGGGARNLSIDEEMEVCKNFTLIDGSSFNDLRKVVHDHVAQFPVHKLRGITMTNQWCERFCRRHNLLGYVKPPAKCWTYVLSKYGEEQMVMHGLTMFNDDTFEPPPDIVERSVKRQQYETSVIEDRRKKNKANSSTNSNKRAKLDSSSPDAESSRLSMLQQLCEIDFT